MKSLFTTLLIGCLAASAYAQTTFKEWVAAGESKLQAGKYSGAITDFTKALNLNPSATEIYLQRGVAKMKNSDDEGAILDFTQSIRLQPNNASAYAYRSESKMRRNDTQGALYDVNKAIAQDENNADYYQLRGQLSEKMGLTAQANIDKQEYEHRKNGQTALQTPKEESQPTKRATPVVTVNESVAPTEAAPVEKKLTKKEEKALAKAKKVAEEKALAEKEDLERRQKKAKLAAEEKAGANNGPKYNDPTKNNTVASNDTPKPKETRKKEPTKVAITPPTPKEQPKEQPKVETPKVENPKIAETVAPKEPTVIPAPKASTTNVDAATLADASPQLGTSLGVIELTPTGGMSTETTSPRQPQPPNSPQQTQNTQSQTPPNLQASREKTRNQKEENAQKEEKTPYTPTPSKTTPTPSSSTPKPVSNNTASAPVKVPKASPAAIRLSIFNEARRMAYADNHKGAVEMLDQFIAEDKNDAAAFLNRGISKSALEDIDGALADFATAQKLTPNMPEVYYNRANIYFDQHKYIEAMTEYSAALDKNHDYVQAYLNRALTKRALGGTLNPCEDWLAAKKLGSKKAQKMLESFCDTPPEELPTTADKTTKNTKETGK